jgi:hypothetical protein
MRARSSAAVRSFTKAGATICSSNAHSKVAIIAAAAREAEITVTRE